MLALVANVALGGGILAPLYMGNIVPALDENGQPLCGLYNTDPATRDRLEIRTAALGVIFPPLLVGGAHPDNPLLSPDSIGGMGMNSSALGMFCMVFPWRPAAGTKVFTRAYNAQTVAEASFYVDSALAICPLTGASLVFWFGTAQTLDPGDADGDGLNNSWEKSLGTADRLTPDYDADGMSDWAEWQAGTDPRDANSVLAFHSVSWVGAPVTRAADGATGQTMCLRFQSIPGKKYQIEFAPSLQNEQVFMPVGEAVTAGSGETELEIRVDMPPDAATGFFRLKLVETE